jgi:predicted transglutaminase-like protease
MLTFTLTNNATNNGGRSWNELSTGEQVSVIIIMILVIALIVWAWMRALKCSTKSPDSRAIHLLFATVDPILYLIFSYFIDGMCN